MSLIELATKRQSVRDYLPVPVEREKIERCCEAARLAPSANNAQPWKYLIVDDPDLRKRVIDVGFSGTYSVTARFITKAPVIVLLVTDKGKLISRFGSLMRDTRYNLIDTGLSCAHFTLQAAEEGLGACVIGWFDEKALGKLFNLTKGSEVAVAISLGYPKDTTPRKKVRKELDEIRRYNIG